MGTYRLEGRLDGDVLTLTCRSRSSCYSWGRLALSDLGFMSQILAEDVGMPDAHSPMVLKLLSVLVGMMCRHPVAPSYTTWLDIPLDWSSEPPKPSAPECSLCDDKGERPGGWIMPGAMHPCECRRTP